jgi:hypothetical protein
VARLYPEFTRIVQEISVDPHSGFWYYHQEVDFADPLSILIRCEEGDEEALELVSWKQALRGF